MVFPSLFMFRSSSHTAFHFSPTRHVRKSKYGWPKPSDHCQIIGSLDSFAGQSHPLPQYSSWNGQSPHGKLILLSAGSTWGTGPGNVIYIRSLLSYSSLLRIRISNIGPRSSCGFCKDVPGLHPSRDQPLPPLLNISKTLLALSAISVSCSVTMDCFL